MSSWIRSRGTTRWMPLDARTWNWPRSPTSAWVSSVHTPVALTTCLARTSNALAALQVVHPDAGDPLALPQEARRPARRLATSAPYAAAVRTSVSVCRASSTCAS